MITAVTLVNNSHTISLKRKICFYLLKSVLFFSTNHPKSQSSLLVQFYIMMEKKKIISTWKERGKMRELTIRPTSRKYDTRYLYVVSAWWISRADPYDRWEKVFQLWRQFAGYRKVKGRHLHVREGLPWWDKKSGDYWNEVNQVEHHQLLCTGCSQLLLWEIVKTSIP